LSSDVGPRIVLVTVARCASTAADWMRPHSLEDGNERRALALSDVQTKSEALGVGLRLWIRGVIGSGVALFDAGVQQRMRDAGF
jgi:hypothetical protein